MTVFCFRPAIRRIVKAKVFVVAAVVDRDSIPLNLFGEREDEHLATGTNVVLVVVAVILLFISHAVDYLTYFIEISRIAGGNGKIG